jgi:hypothetical protein
MAEPVRAVAAVDIARVRSANPFIPTLLTTKTCWRSLSLARLLLERLRDFAMMLAGASGAVADICRVLG